MTTTIKFSRREAVAFLIERDGDYCKFPDCDRPFDEKDIRTLDHIYPQSKARADGWTYEEINAYSNLQLMHKTCNVRKGDLEYDADGILHYTIPEPKVVRVARPEICDTCYSGRLLFLDELCDVCGSGPQPAKYPGTLQRKPKECDHSTYHCWRCVVDDPTLRVSAISRILTGP